MYSGQGRVPKEKKKDLQRDRNGWRACTQEEKRYSQSKNLPGRIPILKITEVVIKDLVTIL